MKKRTVLLSMALIVSLMANLLVIPVYSLEKGEVPLGFQAVIADDFSTYNEGVTPSYFSTSHAVQKFSADGNGFLTNFLTGTVHSDISLPSGGSLVFNDFIIEARLQRDAADQGQFFQIKFLVEQDSTKEAQLYISRQKYVVRLNNANLVEKNFSTVTQLQGYLDDDNYLDLDRLYDFRFSIVDDVCQLYIKESTQKDYTKVYEVQREAFLLASGESRTLRFSSAYNSLFNLDDLYFYLPKITKGLPQKEYVTIMNTDFEDNLLPANFNLITSGASAFFVADSKLQKADGAQAKLEVLNVDENGLTRNLLDFEVETQFIIKNSYVRSGANSNQSAKFIAHNTNQGSTQTVEVWIRGGQVMLIANGNTEIASVYLRNISALSDYIDSEHLGLQSNVPCDLRFGIAGNNAKVYIKHADSDDYILIIDKTDDRINVSGQDGLKNLEVRFDWNANVELNDFAVYEKDAPLIEKEVMASFDTEVDINNVSLLKTLLVNFNSQMDGSTLTKQNILIKDGNTVVDNYSINVISDTQIGIRFTEGMEYSKQYSLEFTDEVKDKQGKSVTINNVLQFTTESEEGSDILFAEDFESPDRTYNFTAAGTQHALTFSQSGGSTLATVDNPDSTVGGKALKLSIKNDTSSTAYIRNSKSFGGVYGGGYILSIDLFIPSSAMPKEDDVLQFFLNNGTISSEYFYLSSDLAPDRPGNKRYTKNFPRDKWFTVQYVFDFDNTQTYAAYIIEDGTVREKITEDRALAPIIKDNGLKTLRISTAALGKTGIQDIYFDNFIMKSVVLEKDCATTTFYNAATGSEITYTGIVQGQIKAVHRLREQNEVGSLAVVTALHEDNRLVDVYLDNLTQAQPSAQTFINVTNDNQKIKVFYFKDLNSMQPVKNCKVLGNSIIDCTEANMVPFWQSEVMYNESLTMVAFDGKMPEAPLLFEPTEIISVRNAALDIVYEEGVDWIYENGSIKLLEGTRAFYFTEEEYYPSTSSSMTMSRVGGGYLLFSENTYFHERQLAVTYKHNGMQWNGPTPQYQGDRIPKTMAKLNNKEPITVVLYGDSIAAGANASGREYSSFSPYLPIWGDLVAQKLRDEFDTKVTFINTSVGGTASSWGVENAQTLVAQKNPDLVIISFGMNDGAKAVAPQTYIDNLQSIMDTVRSSNPDVEFILVSSSLPNPESASVNAGSQELYLPYLQQLCNDAQGVALADITTPNQKLLEKKRFVDMTGNNINHPNDFMIRWYAQIISAIFLQ